jgi:hypothetical protein
MEGLRVMLLKLLRAFVDSLVRYSSPFTNPRQAVVRNPAGSLCQQPNHGFLQDIIAGLMPNLK